MAFKVSKLITRRLNDCFHKPFESEQELQTILTMESFNCHKQFQEFVYDQKLSSVQTASINERTGRRALSRTTYKQIRQEVVRAIKVILPVQEECLF
uniref:Transposase n=1 Tax=Syphacia muris TaxID=451379 RepID=A0A0N5APA2_9BILA